MVISLALGGCASGETSDGEQSLTFAIEGANISDGHLDIHKTQIDASAMVLRNVFDSLVDLDAQGNPVPWLAQSWTVAEDGLTYTFHLRNDVTFQDGEPFNAAAVQANFDHVVAPETESAQALSLLGGDLYAGTDIVDDYTVNVRFTAPFAPFLQNASSTLLGFYSPVVLETHADELAAGGPGITVGSGPFELTDFTPGQQLVMEKFTDYNWPSEAASHSGPALLDRLVITILPESAVRIGALTSGEADVATDLPPSSVKDLGSEVAVTSIDLPGLPYSLYLNDGFGVFRDVKVRQAFRQGMDIDSAVKTVFSGQYDRAWSILGPTTPNAYDASLEGTWQYDRKKANALLDEAGWTVRDTEGYRTKEGKRLSATWTAYTPVSEENQSLANAFQEDLKAIGFELVRENLEPAQYMEKYTPRAFDLTDWAFSGVDPDLLRNHLHSDGYQTVSTVSRPDIDALLDGAAASTDPTQRADLYRQVQQWNNDFVSIVPIYVPSAITAAGLHVRGLAYDLYGRPLFYGVSVT
ncbi:ABC transporter substrate-binding protein [Klugiella xanthotipulae]|uniref:ABC transporter substrate-binding protein n=1 Tax=Klugiella xanthotipulae TaxID=244735 RepID=UPI001FE9EC60|nr:ABC transporter substrate-binding protein [Klugiella xanthotipulae]